MKHVGIDIKFYNRDTFKKQIDVNFIDLDSNLVDLNYKVTSLIFCHFWRSIRVQNTGIFFSLLLVMMTLLYLPSVKPLYWFYVPSMILLTCFYILATDEKVKNGHKTYGTLMINRGNHILIVFHLHGRVKNTK